MIMAEFIWELGIDWNAVETEGVSYLRGGLVNQVSGNGLPGTAPGQIGHRVIFRILDVTSSGGAKVAAIASFNILTQAAVQAQLFNNGLSTLQPALTLDP